jgi:hypothetical protein
MKGISAMTTYSVYFRTDRNYAFHDIEADTPEQALARARQLRDSGEILDEYEEADAARASRTPSSSALQVQPFSSYARRAVASLTPTGRAGPNGSPCSS